MKISAELIKTFPVTVPAFVSRVGAVGIDLIPMIIVALNFPIHQASIIMASLRAAGIAGNIVGGWLCDVTGIRQTLQIGFLSSAIAMATLPFIQTWWLIAVVGFVAQLGNEILKQPNRMVIFQTFPKSEQSKGIAWFRSANNFGYIFAFVVSFAAAKFGFIALMLFDSATSLVAAGLSYRLVRNVAPLPKPIFGLKVDDFKLPKSFFLVAGVGAVYSFLYRFLITGSSARAKVLFGENAIQVFSIFMVINAAMCAFLAIWAAKRFEDPKKASTLGISLTLLGLMLLASTDTAWGFWLASFLATLGEVIIMSLMVIWVFRHTPESARQSLHMGIGMTLQHIGGLAGSALAFPLLVFSKTPVQNVFLISLMTIVLTAACFRGLRKQSTLR